MSVALKAAQNGSSQVGVYYNYEGVNTKVPENTMKPMLDPKRDLAGATPETLARALFRRTGTLRPSSRRKAVVRDQITEKKPAANKAGDGVSHLGERP